MNQDTHPRPAGVSEAEWQARIDLAALHRLVALRGWDDLIFTHLSLRVPGEEEFLFTPFGLLFEEVTASSLVKLDGDGNLLVDTPHGVNPAGFVIHSALHLARDDARCVVHLHTPSGQAVSAQAEGLLPLTQTAMLVGRRLAYHDYEGVVTRPDERARLVADLGEHDALILRNHGTLAVGRDAAEAWLVAYTLERACEAQVLALSGRAELRPAPELAAERTHEEGLAFMERGAAQLTWAAMLRMLDRRDPGYRA